MRRSQHQGSPEPAAICSDPMTIHPKDHETGIRAIRRETERTDRRIAVRAHRPGKCRLPSGWGDPPPDAGHQTRRGGWGAQTVIPKNEVVGADIADNIPASERRRERRGVGRQVAKSGWRIRKWRRLGDPSPHRRRDAENGIRCAVHIPGPPDHRTPDRHAETRHPHQ